MMNSLDALTITFFVMSAISLLGVIVLFTARNPKLKNGMFYFLSVWGMVIAYANISSIPEYLITELIIALALGALSVAGIILKNCKSTKNSVAIARWLVAISVIVGMIDCFVF